MHRRTFLVGTTFGAAGLAAQSAYAQYFDNAWLKTPSPRPLAPADIESAVEKLRKQFRAEFDAAYVENVIVPHFLVSVYDGERPILPMIGVELTKENALPYDLWGLLSETWKPDPEQGVTVFLQGLEKRGRTTSGSASTCRRSRRTFTGRCMATRSSPSSTSC